MSVKEKPRHTSAKEFVDPNVQTIQITDQIIAQILPFFPKSAKVISGYMTEEQLYWKVNYHWDVLLEAIGHCSGLSIDQKHKDALAAIKKALEAVPPDPKTGYRKSKMGVPVDKSSHAAIVERHAVVARCKRDFKAVVIGAAVFSKTKRDPKALMLAYAPVASPANGQHKTGYALDIKGNNADIARIAASLGATTVLIEGSHVHCEWKKGVDTSGKGGSNSVESSARGVRVGLVSRNQHHHHCLLRRE